MADLTEKQLKFARARAKGLSPSAAARQAGYSHPHTVGIDLDKKQEIQLYIAKEAEKFEKKNDITREKVFSGLMESIEMAKLMGEPMTMVSGWREIGKMAGYYEPETRKLEISVNGQVTVQQLQSMSDAELLRLAESHIVEGEFTPIPELEDKS